MANRCLHRTQRILLIGGAAKAGWPPDFFLLLIIIIVSFLPVFLLESQGGGPDLQSARLHPSLLRSGFSSVSRDHGGGSPVLMVLFIGAGACSPRKDNPISRSSYGIYLRCFDGACGKIAR